MVDSKTDTAKNSKAKIKAKVKTLPLFAPLILDAFSSHGPLQEHQHNHLFEYAACNDQLQ